MRKYRLSVLLEKSDGANHWQIVKDHSIVFDDYSNTERMFVLLVDTEGKILERIKDNEQENKKQGNLFKKK